MTKFFRSCLKEAHRKSISRGNPLTNSQALRCLKVDDDFRDFLGGSFPKKMDDRYKRVQYSINAAAAPALKLWKDLEEQGFTRGKGSLMPVDSTLDIIQRTLVLTGNASNYISQCRRDSIISKVKLKNSRLGSILSDICQEHQPDDKNLFWSEVRKVLSERAESLSAMKKLSSRLETSRTSGGRRDSQFFRKGPSSDRGRRAGRIFRPQPKLKAAAPEPQKALQPEPSPSQEAVIPTVFLSPQWLPWLSTKFFPIFQ